MGRRNAQFAGQRLAFIEGLRGLAALYVVLGHVCALAVPGVFLGMRTSAPLWLRNGMQPFGYGHLAVAAFIVISGFCLQTSLFNRDEGRLNDVKRFFKRRALRILPPYYACLAISLYVAYKITPLGQGLPFTLYLPVTPQSVVAHVLMVHNWSPDWMYKINGVLWSIAIEVQLYILFPLFVLLINKANRSSTVLLAMAIPAAVLFAWPQADKLYPWYMALFVLGMAAAHLAFAPPKWRGPNALASLLFGGLALAGCVWSATQGHSMAVLDCWMGACVISVLYACTVSKKFTLCKILAMKPLAWLGAISYSLYLMHHPILQPLFIFRPTWAQAPLPATLYLLSVGLPCVLAAVTVFWFVFERPFVSKPERKPKAAPPSPSTPRKAVVNAPAKERVPVGSAKR